AVSRRRRGPQARLYRACHLAILRGRRLTTATLLPPPSLRGFTPPVTPSQGWRTFLRNHAPDIAAMDLFVVPPIGFDLLYVLVIVRLERRDLVWINVTTNPGVRHG
ncbi:MAG: hypothetical protein ACXW3S_15525, partial [Rhodoplanes sp.]